MRRPDPEERGGFVLRVRPRFAGSRWWIWEVRSPAGDVVAQGPPGPERLGLHRIDAQIDGRNAVSRLLAGVSRPADTVAGPVPLEH